MPKSQQNVINKDECAELHTQKIETLKHNAYCHYTTLDTVQKILNGKYIYASNVKNANDTDERKRHLDDKTSKFFICFCASDTEKIPLWCIYSGISGGGARIRLTKGEMRKFIESIKYAYVVEKGKPDTNRKLENGKDFTVEYGYIYYVKSERNYKYQNKYFYEDYDKDKINDFLKNYEWEYENEFRIMISLTKYQEKLDNIAIPINCNFGIMLAPSAATDDNKAKFADKYKIEESKIGLEMNLVEKNYSGFIAYISNPNNKYKPAEICDALKKASNCKGGKTK